jgi:hypothetical protein
MLLEIFIIAIVIGASPLVARGLKGDKKAWNLLGVILIMILLIIDPLYKTGNLIIKQHMLILRIIGVIILTPGVLILNITGKEHHERSGNPPLFTPNYEPMDPDLVRMARFGFLFIAVGGILLLLAWLLP